MLCIKNSNIKITVSDCEKCLTNRIADKLCFQKRFAWGYPDDVDPIWEYTNKEAREINEDVSKYYDPGWEGNSHLIIHKKQLYRGYKKQYIPPEIRWAVWERDNFKCQECGKRKFLSIDHIYPESLGGTLELNNLQTLCINCNSKKGIKIK